MIELPQTKTKRLLAVHGWSGTILGLFLYIVIVTGTVAVFAFEIGRWSVGGVAHHDPMLTSVHDRVAALAETVDPEHLDEISVYPNSGGNLVVFFHKHAMNAAGEPDDYGEMIELDPNTGEAVLRREGFGAELFGTDPASALDAFLIDLHVNLYLPSPWGLYATGVLGFIMFLAAGTGLLIHRHLLQDLFVAPRFSSLLLTKRDRHVLAGSWGLPFAFVLAFTGAYLSFSGALGLPLVAKSAFGGDMMAMIETVFGVPDTEDPTPAARGSLDRIISQSVDRTGTAPEFVTISHWGRADGIVTLAHPPTDGAIEGPTHVFNAVTGAFQSTKPTFGLQPSAGNTAFNLMGALHYGHFAGLLSKFVWLSLGFAMAYVSLTGLRLWIERRSESPLWRQFGVTATVVCYGLPIALCGAAYGFFFSLGAGASQFWTPFSFVITSAISIVAGIIWRDAPRLKEHFILALGLALIAAPLLRLLTIGGGWGIGGPFDEIVVMMDVLLVIGGLACLKSALDIKLLPSMKRETEIAPAE
ncbi:MAG: PepSY-associated TM helix domain-containing protein [Pseudomonadota bacterium]